MSVNNRKFDLLTAVPPWVIIGTVALLVPLFTFVTLDTIHRQEENSTRLLLEKGAALIRSFEAATRTGMRSERSDFKLQRLLIETAQQPDIVYLIVADVNGRVVAHNDLSRIDSRLENGMDLAGTVQLATPAWRKVLDVNGREVFEVYRRFIPTGAPRQMPMRRMRGPRHKRPPPDRHPDEDPTAQAIFVGLDMTSVEAAGKADIQHAVLMGVILLLVGFAGIVLLFVLQGYRASRASLSRARAFSDTLVENMPIGLIALDADKTIATVNPVAGSTLDLSAGRLVGQPADKGLPKALVRQLIEIDHAGFLADREIECELGDGRRIPISFSGGILKNGENERQGYVLLFKDLSEVYGLRQEIARNQRLAAVGRLAAGVAHEIRNPLSSIKGFATYFKERYQAVAKDRQIAETMIQEVDRLNRVISQLLEFSRPVTISPKTVAAHAVIEESIRLVSSQAEQRAVTVATCLPPQVSTIRIDPDRIRQILLNLYLNAIDAMETGGQLTVSLATGPEAEQFRITVSDTGRGIPEEDLAHVFDPYFTTKPTGTGLGLAIVHNIVEALGGDIQIESRPGRGTTVSVTFPGLVMSPAKES